MTQLNRSVTKDEIAAYKNVGVVLLREILSLAAVNGLRRSIDEAVKRLPHSPSGYDLSYLTRAAEAQNQDALHGMSSGQYDIAGIMEYVKSSGKPFLLDEIGRSDGSFLLDTGISARLRQFRAFCLSGAVPEIAAAILESNKVNFFGDQIFVKEPGTRERTAFHQDATYFEIAGDQCCVMWIPVVLQRLRQGRCNPFADRIAIGSYINRMSSLRRRRYPARRGSRYRTSKGTCQTTISFTLTSNRET